MFRTAVSFMLLTTTFAVSPLYEVKQYKLSEVDLSSISPTTYGEHIVVTDGHTRSVVEVPHGGGVPPDEGGNFGDIEFAWRPKTGRLIARDTVVNRMRDEDIYLTYSRTFPGYYIDDLRVYNVGRERGYTISASMSHDAGGVQAGIFLEAGKTMRMIIETYALREDN